MPKHPGYQDGTNLAVSLCLTYVICISCVRLWIRKGSYGSDDVVIAIATVISFAHTATNYLALANGLGTPWEQSDASSDIPDLKDSENLPVLNAASLSGTVLFTVALYLTKCATLTFLGRITKAQKQIMFYYIVNSVVATVGIVSVLLVSLACPSEPYYWDFHNNKVNLDCPSQSIRWQAFTGLDIVTEIILLALPVQLVWSLQMSLVKKVMIVTAFSLRLPVIGLSIARNYFTLQLRLPSTDVGLASGLVVIFLECQLAYALASSTLSASKAFTESFNSGFGLGFTRNAGEDSYGLSDVSGKSGASKDEKSRGDSTIDTANGAKRSPPPRPPRTLEADRIDALLADNVPHSTSPLKLRPDTEGRTFTSVSARPGLGAADANADHGPFSTESASSSNYSSTNDDMAVHLETSVEVHRDDSPILHRPLPGAYI